MSDEKFANLVLESPCSSTFTPDTDSQGTMDATSGNGRLTGGGEVPWPNTTYLIVEKATGRVLTLTNGEVVVKSSAMAGDRNTHWLCVEKSGYFGFVNPPTGRYVGHDGKNHIYAAAKEMKDYEYLTPRLHPNGGFQLLSPQSGSALKLLCVTENLSNLARRHHGTTLWEFRKVEGI